MMRKKIWEKIWQEKISIQKTIIREKIWGTKKCDFWEKISFDNKFRKNGDIKL